MHFPSIFKHKKTLAQPDQPSHSEMDLLDHLRELRKRLLIVIATLLVTSVIAFCFSSQLFSILSDPFRFSFSNQQLIGTGPAEAFVLKLHLAFFGGVVLASPILFQQFWLFVAPGLHPQEKRLAIPFITSGTALFIGGIWFCHTLVLPLSFTFFHNEFTSLGIEPNIRISEYLTLILQADLGFGAVFELPLISLFLGKLGIIDHHTLIRGSRHAIVIIFVVAAILTPPDVLTQLLMAGPLLLLYGVSILLVKYCVSR